jgi:hypothetical protein
MHLLAQDFQFYKMSCKYMKYLTFFNFQINEGLENTYVLSNCAYCNPNISNL